MEVAENEVIKTPQNKILDKLAGSANYMPSYKLNNTNLETKSSVLHEMHHI